MSEQERLENEDPIAGALFEAARSYRPSMRARRATMRALGLPVGLSLFGSALAHAVQVAAPFKGWIVAGALTAATVGGGAVYLGQRPARERVVATATPRPAREARPRTAARPAPEVAPAPVAEISAPAPAAPSSAPVRAPARRRRSAALGPAPIAPIAAEPASVTPPPQPPLPPAPAPAPVTGPAPLPMPMLSPSPSPPPAPPPRAGLDAELGLIEAARRDLASAPRRALDRLDEYDRTFPRGLLGEEAEILRLAALAGAGAPREAAARAEAFLAAHPHSPLAARARTFLVPSTPKP